MNRINTCAAIAAITLLFTITLDAQAQQGWNSGHPSSCSEHGGCQHGTESLELIPYGQSFESASRRIPYRDSYRASYDSNRAQYDSYRAPYQGSYADYQSGDCQDGSCSRSHQPRGDQYSRGPSGYVSSGRCPCERQQFEQGSYEPRRAYANQSPYRSGYEGSSNFDTRPNYADSYSVPRQRGFEGYQQTPADRRPELRTSPPFESESNYGRSEPQQNRRALIVPRTTTQIMPPPELPPQTSAFRQSSPQLLPPTSRPNTSQSNHNHAGHENCDHDH